MAKLTKFLGSVANGIFGSQGDMRDYQHAARLFTDNFMRLSPKVEFLYHVFLDINPAAIRTPNPFYGFSSPEARIETGMLVKNFNLPGISVQTETKNQYGKKTNIQTAVQYNPVNLTFHDDNNGLIGGLWEQYFKSQYADSQFVDFLQIEPTYNSQTSTTETVNTRADGLGADQTKTTTTSTKQTGLKFGFDNYKSVRFFNTIKLYQLSKKRFFEFELINPIIQSWTPPTMNSSSSNPAENQMTVIYEGVRYNTGRISTESVKGFTALHYDNIPSPLGSGGAGLFGPGGVLAGGLDVVGDVIQGDIFTDPFALIGTAIKAKRTYDNAKELNREGIRNEVTGIVTRSITNAANRTITMSGFDTVDQNLATPANQTVETVFNPAQPIDLDSQQGAGVGNQGENSTTSTG
jgi:hypothetical protein